MGISFPWIIISVFPALICYFLLFTPLTELDNWGIFLYMIIMLCLFDFFYTLFSIHFYGSFTMQFRSDEERRKASSYTNIIPGIGVLLVSLIPPLIIVYRDIESYALAALLVVLVLAIFAIILIPGVRESEELKELYINSYESAEKVSFLKTAKIAFKHRSMVVYTIALLLFYTAYYLTIASDLYYFQDILGLDYSYAIFSILASAIAFIISIPFWYLVSKKIGNANTFILGVLFVSLAFIPFLWVTTLEEFIIFQFIAGIGFGAFFYIAYAIFADINDEVALTMEKRLESTLAGIRTVIIRIAIFFQAIIMVIVHIATGYSPGSIKQTPLAIWGIRIHAALIPAILCFVAFLILLIWYDLKGEKKEKIFAQLKEKGLK